jgi:hypothetical protein
MSYLRCDNKINKMISERKKKKETISTQILYIKINMTGFHYLAILSGVHLNLSSKLALKSRLSVCRVKTQTTQKVKLDLNI